MSQVNAVPSASSTPTSNFQSILNAALEGYEKKAKERLLTHPLAAQLQSCDSPAEVLSVWLIPTVNVLYAFSATLGKGARLVFSPANVIFAGIGVLLLVSILLNFLLLFVVTPNARRPRMWMRAKMCSSTSSGGSRTSFGDSNRIRKCGQLRR